MSDQITVIVQESPVEVTKDGDDVTVNIVDETTVVSILQDDDIDVDVSSDPISVEVTETVETVVVEVTEVLEVPDRTSLVDDVGGGVTYIGKAAPGSDQALAQWQISRLTEATIWGSGDDLKVEWADLGTGDGPNANFDKVWDDRLSYSYG